MFKKWGSWILSIALILSISGAAVLAEGDSTDTVTFIESEEKILAPNADELDNEALFEAYAAAAFEEESSLRPSRSMTFQEAAPTVPVTRLRALRPISTRPWRERSFPLQMETSRTPRSPCARRIWAIRQSIPRPSWDLTEILS